MVHMDLFAERASRDDEAVTSAEVRAGTRERWPLFDLMRVVAACAVVVSHSMVLTGGDSRKLLYLGPSRLDLGGLSVAVFFVLSGWLITASWGRNSAGAFALRRFARIMPGLAAAAVLSVVIGAGVTTSLSGFFTDGQTWRFLTSNALMRPLVERELPGVFGSNPTEGIVNGSLWTLPHEAISYLAVAFLGVLGLLRRWVVLGATVACLGVFALGVAERSFVGPTGLLWDDLVLLAVWFLLGSCAYLWRHLLPWGTVAGVVAVAALLVLNGTPMAMPAFAYLALWIGTRRSDLHLPAWMGDPSYGIYVYAFPVQQAIVAVAPWGRNPAAHLLTALPIIVALGVLSWHHIEAPIMRRVRLRRLVGDVPPQDVARRDREGWGAADASLARGRGVLPHDPVAVVHADAVVHLRPRVNHASGADRARAV